MLNLLSYLRSHRGQDYINMNALTFMSSNGAWLAHCTLLLLL